MECPNCLDTFPDQFIKKYHTFPSGTQRKVTDVFAKEERANHLIGDPESAALGSPGELADASMRELRATDSGVLSAATLAARGESEGPFFVADLIDLTELDKIIDNSYLRAGDYSTSMEALDGRGAEDVLHRLLHKAVDHTHKLYLKAKP